MGNLFQVFKFIKLTTLFKVLLEFLISNVAVGYGFEVLFSNKFKFLSLIFIKKSILWAGAILKEDFLKGLHGAPSRAIISGL